MERTKSSHHYQYFLTAVIHLTARPQNLQKMHKFSLSCILLNAQNSLLSTTIITWWLLHSAITASLTIAGNILQVFVFSIQ